MIDVGGTNVKLMVTGRKEPRKFPSGCEMTAQTMAEQVREAAKGWQYDAITIGFPGLVVDGQLAREPLNLAAGWLGFDFECAFGKPVRIINDAALQALAHYTEGRMLFTGFGTSIGAALVADDVVIPVEVGLIPFTKKQTFVSRLTKKARKKKGHHRWQASVYEAIELLQDIFWPTETVIGGGNAKHLDPLPPNCWAGSNRDAFVGALRMWEGSDLLAKPYGTTWRIERH